MPLLEQTKSDIRRHLEFSTIGLWRQQNAGAGTLAPVNTGFRMFNSYGQLEYRMNNLQPNEECRMTGNPYGAFGFSQGNPLYFTIPVSPSSSITVNVASTAFGVDSPVTVTYDVTSTDTFLTICGQLAQLLSLNSTFASAGFYALNDFGNGPYGQPNNASQQVTFPIVSIVSPNPQTTFTLTVAGTGQTIPQIVQQGVNLHPSLTSNLTVPPTTIWGYVPICNYLEDQMAGATSDNLSALQANDAILRLSEMRDRKKLYRYYCKRLGDFIGISMNPDKPSDVLSGNWSCM